MKRFPVYACLGLGLVLLTVAPSSRADPWNKKTVFDFPRPVEVPGTVLQPGRYVFKLVDSPSNRNIVMISNERENHVYATVLTIPDYRMRPTGKTVLTFYEAPQGQPEAIHTWFYPGDTYGHEFTYKKRALQAATYSPAPPAPPAPEPAAQLKTREPEAPAQTAAPEVAMAEPRKAEEPRPEPEVAAAEPAPAPAPQAAAAPEPTPTPAPAREMPATASDLPLLGLLGLVGLGSALVLKASLARSES